MIIVHVKGVKRPKHKDKVYACRAYIRIYVRTYLCWRVSGVSDGELVLRFGGPELEVPFESRCEEIAELCRLWWEETK